MSSAALNKPGTLVKYRSRDWMVLPSSDPELMRIKPLGGSEDEETAIYLPLQIPGEEVESASFSEPTVNDLGAFSTGKLLFDAARLSFRNASGPFRCMGKLSFRPRSYQLVPLVMALKQDTVRLLVADDVGIGKTIEALIILKELMERGDVQRFAVVCPPHLCEQWQQELKDKLDIHAEIIRSSTAARLDRTIPDDHSVFHHVPYQIVSIDYVKSDKRRGIFISDCPELLIVDEAHTCTLPEGATSKSQQQRYSLLYDLAEKSERHLLFLTATPHSGKDSEFLSLIGLLKKEFRTFNLENIDQNKRRDLAKHFIQRKRSNIKRWLNEVTTFPERQPIEKGYALSIEYMLFYQNILRFARGISSKEGDSKQTSLLRSWAAIALIRGVMSSPAMAVEMLRKRKEKLMAQDELELESLPKPKNVLFEQLESTEDTFRTDLIDAIDFASSEIDELESLCNEAELLKSLEYDRKLQVSLKHIKEWLKDGYHPIIFCKYIATAKYLAEYFKSELPNTIHVEAITSELVDEQRKERIEVMGKADKRVLIATDCLSEGINLQEYFTAVMHYDLPWNPNRLEQREGRIDRFGQDAPIVKVCTLFGEDNEMDNFVMEVLIRKVRDIHKTTGVTIAIGEDSENLMTKAAQKILFDSEKSDGKQTSLFAEETVKNELELARKKGDNLRSIFAHESIKPESIQKDLEAVDESIGDMDSVEHFVINALQYLGASTHKDGKGFVIQVTNLPPHLKNHFSGNQSVKVSFDSPTPKGFRYIGRNHLFVEQLCHFVLSLAFDGHPEYNRVARVAQIQTDAVSTKTVLVMFRVRNVIKEVRSKREVISEEMYLWGYRGFGESVESIEYPEAKALLMEAKSLTNISLERQQIDIKRELTQFHNYKSEFMELATERAENLVEAHGRFKELVGGRRYEKATPVLPPDVMGVYILMPKAVV